MTLELLFPHFDELIRTPEDVQRLNEAILQLAVRGKLVAQDPEDEPASELLKRIKAKKEHLSAERRIAKSKPMLPISQRELSFELPIRWSWSRLGDTILEIQTGPFGSALHKSDYIDGGVPVVNPANIRDGRIEPLANMAVSEETKKRLGRYVLEKGDIVMGRRGEMGRCAVVTETEAGWLCGSGTFNLKASAEMSQEFLVRLIRSPEAREYLSSGSVGSTMNNLNHRILGRMVVGVPPLAEQHRIVAKVDALFAQTRALEASLRQAQADIVIANRATLHRLHTAQDDDQFQAAWRTIRDHFDVLYDDPRNVAELRQAILDLAVRGKLVAQDSADEPAGELLKRIEAEKRRLAGGHKVLRRIQAVDLEIGPYPLPPAWVWVRVGDAGIINARNNVDADTLVSFIPMALINDGIGSGHSAQVALWRDVRNGFTHFAENDVGIAKITPCFQNRKSTVFRDLTNGVGAGTTELHVFRSFGGCVLPDYALLFFQSPEFIEKGKASMTGTAGQQRVPRSYVEEALFPLPPVVEQHRIVTKVDQLMRLCDALEAGLLHAQAGRQRLVEAVLHAVSAG